MPQSEVEDYIEDRKPLRNATVASSGDGKYYITHSETKDKYLHFIEHMLRPIKEYDFAESCIFLEVLENKILASACFVERDRNEFYTKLQDISDDEITVYITPKNQPAFILDRFTFTPNDFLLEEDEVSFNTDLNLSDCELYAKQYIPMRKST